MSNIKKVKIGIYTRHKLEIFSAELACELKSEFDVFIFSEDKLSNSDIFDAERFYSFKGNVECLSDVDIEDIRLRCRVLRSLDRDLAISLISRAIIAVQGMLSHLKPDVIISPRIDDYYLDILERVCVLNGINFIGLWRSAFLDGMFFQTARGEFNKLRNPGESEVLEFLRKMTDKKFQATSIANKKYSRFHSLVRYFNLYVRAIILETIRRFSSNKFRYRELATRFFVQEYDVGIFDIYYNYHGWKSSLEVLLKSKNPKVFFALQVNPESTIDYYCQNIELVDIHNITPNIINCFLANGYDLVIKDHPNMIGSRDANFLRRLASQDDRVVIVPPSVSSIYLIDNTDVTYTWSGTVAVQAVMMGRKAVCVCVPYFIDIEGFFKVSSLTELNDLLTQENFLAKPTVRQRDLRMLAAHILSSHLPGDVYLHNKNMPGDVLATAESLRKIIGNYGVRHVKQ